jgi:hypothetical protein
MRKIIIALALVATASSAFAKVGPDGQKLPRDTTTIKACGVQWKQAKADEAVKAAGWPKYWHECAQRAKAAKTIAP